MSGKMIKIAISGQARVGKNTLAEMIVNNLTNHFDSDYNIKSNYKIVAVADPIKNMVMQMVPSADRNCLWGESELRSTVVPGNLQDLGGNQLTYRRLLMDLGTLGRKYNPDIWLNALVQDAAKNKSLKAYIVSDVRFVNEIEYLKQHGFYMVRLKRPGGPKINDISETAQLAVLDSYFDNVIDNNGSLEELNIHAKMIANKLA